MYLSMNVVSYAPVRIKTIIAIKVVCTVCGRFHVWGFK